MSPTSGSPPPLVGRLAPSPTGELHVGHARSFLLAWWSARSRGGEVQLRIEDLDGDRSAPEFVDGIVRDLEWLGMDWDGPPLVQSAGLERIRAGLDQLIDRGLVYPCTCTRREAREAASAPHEGYGGEPAYAGTCRGRYASLEAAEAESGRKAAWRFRVPDEPVAFEDRFLGALSIDLGIAGGDFVVARRDGLPAYQLAVVVDDAAGGITEVLRGDDLVTSCARQALLIDHLGLRRPTWVHVPLVVDAHGERLAKRVSSLSLAHLRASGVRADELIAWASTSSGQHLPRHRGRLRAADLLASFDLAALPHQPVTAPFELKS
jgi:glutamyl-tRNA synthetase